MFLERKYVPKYEDLVKEREKNKSPVRIDEIAKKYNMSVTDVKKLKEDRGPADLTRVIEEQETEINGLKNKIASLEDTLRSKDYWRDPDYKFLVEENAELQKRIIELEQEILEVKVDNKKLAQQISTMMERMRDANF
jgi:predicted RNase H-like nuclease (RuvC/YqgF family)